MSDVAVMEKKDVAKPIDRARRRAVRTRERLLDAALAVFGEFGFDLATIENITERADLGKGTFYRHFEDKQAILQTLIERATGHLIERIVKVKGEPPLTLQEVLAHLFDAHAGYCTQHSAEFLLVFQGRLMLMLQRGALESLGRPFSLYLEAIEQRLAPFMTQPADPAKLRRFACAISGFAFGFFSMASIAMSKDEATASVEPFKRAFLSGAPAFAS